MCHDALQQPYTMHSSHSKRHQFGNLGEKKGKAEDEWERGAAGVKAKLLTYDDKLRWRKQNERKLNKQVNDKSRRGSCIWCWQKVFH